MEQEILERSQEGGKSVTEKDHRWQGRASLIDTGLERRGKKTNKMNFGFVFLGCKIAQY